MPKNTNEDKVDPKLLEILVLAQEIQHGDSFFVGNEFDKVLWLGQVQQVVQIRLILLEKPLRSLILSILNLLILTY